MQKSSSNRVFEGIKVVDFSWSATGPATTKCLADYGATVVHVETGHRVDLVRTCPPYKDNQPSVNSGTWWPDYNSSKLGMALNMKHPTGLKIARSLVAWADVVASSFGPGAMERLGLGYEEIKSIKPDIIAFCTSNLGQTGPRARQVGYGAQLAGLAGLTALTGWADRGPVEPFGGVTDYMTIPLAISAITAALDYRRRTGKGQLIDVSQFEAAVYYLTPVLLEYFSTGRVANRTGNQSDRAAPHGAYRCQGEDRWCAIAVHTDSEWMALCQVMGEPEWAKAQKFATLLGRMNNRSELDRGIETWTQGRSAEEVMSSLQNAGVSAGVVSNGRDAYEDPQLRHRHHFWNLEHSEMGNVNHSSLGFGLTKTPDQLTAAHCLGEHTEYVCTKLLGLSDEEFTALLLEGVFE